MQILTSQPGAQTTEASTPPGPDLAGMPSDTPVRVLFFDYWTEGIFNFKRVVDAAAGEAASFQLFHLGSFRNKSTARFDIISGIPCIDIAAFRGMNLEQILKSLRPDVVIDLNMTGVCDRALFLTCARFRIPTVYLQHGMQFCESETILTWCKQLDRSWKMSEYVRHIRKYRHVLPWYLRAKKGDSTLASFWKVLWALTTSPSTSHFHPVNPAELWPSLALVYNQALAERLTEHWGLPAERIRVVGNPELDGAIRRLHSPLPADTRSALVRSIGLDPDKPILFHADEGLAECGGFGWTPAFRDERLAELYAACRAAGVQLLARPRPVESPGFREFWDGKQGVAVTRELPLVDSVDVSFAAVGTMSTVLETAAALKKPILSPLWYFNGHEIISPYLKCGAAEPVQSPGLFADAIGSALKGELRPATRQFAAHWLGPTDAEVSRKVVDTILAVARQTRTEREGL